MDNGASFGTPWVPGGVQVSDEKDIFDFSLCAWTSHGPWHQQCLFFIEQILGTMK